MDNRKPSTFFFMALRTALVVSVFLLILPGTPLYKQKTSLKKIRETDPELYRFFSGIMQAFPDLVQIKTQGIFQVSGSPLEQHRVTVEFLFEEAGFTSEIGYFPLINREFPHSVPLLFKSLTEKNIFFNTSVNGFFPEATINPPGKYRYHKNIWGKTLISFFLLPNSRLSWYQDYPVIAPIFCIRELNPQKSLQCLLFFSQKGSRKIQGLQGPTYLLLFEDMIAGNKQEKPDYSDVVIALQGVQVWDEKSIQEESRQ